MEFTYKGHDVRLYEDDTIGKVLIRVANPITYRAVVDGREISDDYFLSAVTMDDLKASVEGWIDNFCENCDKEQSAKYYNEIAPIMRPGQATMTTPVEFVQLCQACFDEIVVDPEAGGKWSDVPARSSGTMLSF